MRAVFVLMCLFGCAAKPTQEELDAAEVQRELLEIQDVEDCDYKFELCQHTGKPLKVCGKALKECQARQDEY